MNKIDHFGQLKLDGGEVLRARLIQINDTLFAAFPEGDATTPILITLSAPHTVKGRLLTANLIGGGTLEFKRASCGCQTPSHLRGPQSKFLALIPSTETEDAPA